MLRGVPVVASNLPGVRQPARLTGMGEIARIGDAADLARQILEVLDDARALPPERRKRSARSSRPSARIEFYESLYREVAGSGAMTPPAMPDGERILRAHLREMPLPPRAHADDRGADPHRRSRFPGPILDIGCGDGHFGSVLFPDGADVGLDPGVADLAEAGRRRAAAGGGAVPSTGSLSARTRARCPSRPATSAPSSPTASSSTSRTSIGRSTRSRRVLAPGRHLRLHGRRRALQRVPDRRARVARAGSRPRAPRIPRLVQSEVRALPLRLAGGLDRAVRAGRHDVRRWRYYLSPRAARAFHRSHYVSLPHLLARAADGPVGSVSAALRQRLLGAPPRAAHGRARARGGILHRVRVRAAGGSSCKMRA